MQRSCPWSLTLPVLLLTALSPALQARPEDEARSDVPRDEGRLDPAEAQQLTHAQLELACALVGALDPADKRGNLVLSPWSITQALAMASAGARGETDAELRKLLRASLPPERLHPALGALERTLNARSQQQPSRRGGRPFTLRSANALWGQAGREFQPDFLRLLAASYGAGMRLVDYGADPDGARARINAWVAESTEQRIKDLLRPPTPSPATRLVLVNAVYFLADWEHPFPQEATRPTAFTRLDGSQVQAPTMHQYSYLQLVQLEGARALALPYTGRAVTCWVLLPDRGDQLDALLTRLPELAGQLTRAGPASFVQLALPKLQFQWRAGLVPALEQLGVSQATDPARADFSGMDGTRELFIGSVTHQAFLAVDERGTEAAAATAVEMAAGSVPPPPVPFLVDRPFLLLIRDDATGAPLFLARVVDPTARAGS